MSILLYQYISTIIITVIIFMLTLGDSFIFLMYKGHHPHDRSSHLHTYNYITK